MSKKSPFDFVKSINTKSGYIEELTGYNPFLTNKTFAMHLDTILLAEEMNQAHQLSPQLQYDFYYYAVKRGKRFGFPKKPEENTNVQLVQEYFKYSTPKALQALQLLSDEQLKEIRSKLDKGGRV